MKKKLLLFSLALWQACAISFAQTPEHPSVEKGNIRDTGTLTLVYSPDSAKWVPKRLSAIGRSLPDRIVDVNTAMEAIYLSSVDKIVGTPQLNAKVPAGITLSCADNICSISGTPTELGVFDYSVTMQLEGAEPRTLTGRITVNSCYTPCPPEGVVINCVCWAKTNVDAPGTFAATPELPGMFYQWNRPTGWSVTDPMINSNGDNTWDATSPTGTEWEAANDPSPEGWRVPTSEEIQSLLETDKVSSEWITQNAVPGRKFTDLATGVSLFFPAVGYRYYNDGTLYGAGALGYFWSSTQYGSSDAYNLHFSSSYAVWGNYYRNNGKSVRAVAE